MQKKSRVLMKPFMELLYLVSCGEGSVAVRLLNNEEIKVIQSDRLVCASDSAYSAIRTTPGQSLEERQKELYSIGSILLSGKDVVLAGVILNSNLNMQIRSPRT